MTYVIRIPQSGAYTRVLNTAARVPSLTWHEDRRCWTTTVPADAATMRRAGAVVEEV